MALRIAASAFCSDADGERRVAWSRGVVFGPTLQSRRAPNEALRRNLGMPKSALWELGCASEWIRRNEGGNGVLGGAYADPKRSDAWRTGDGTP